MIQRAATWLVAVAGACCIILGAVGATIAGASATRPHISLSTTTIVPGQALMITGTGWPINTDVSASICGADAVAGSADCAVTATAVMAAGPKGFVWAHMIGALPPQPCPCVILVSSTYDGYTEKIPVTVVGAGTVPVVRVSLPTVQLSGFRVVGGATLASIMGASAHRMVELRIRNTWDKPVTAVLIGRWGSGKDLKNVLAMPTIRALGAGQSAEVRVPFALAAFSVGNYTVRVEAQVPGATKPFDVTTSSTTWPWGLLVVAVVVIQAILLLIRNSVRRRHPRHQMTDQPPAKQGFDVVAARLIALTGEGDALDHEGIVQSDPSSQLE